MDPEGAPDEFILEEVLGHEEKVGKMFFKVKWEGLEDPPSSQQAICSRDFPAP